ncbi:MAG TPA: alpha/beta family hydrolase [Cyclobacteriaceae bacterium]|nr:alpha/beta family hydrolase [Cyclobacteriaceae bacterium]
MNKGKVVEVQISEKLGNVSVMITPANTPKAVMLLAHGAGAGMKHPFLESVANGLAENSITTVRFNFLYMEKKMKRPDPPAIAEKAVEVLIDHVHSQYPGLKFFVGGKSFGGRMTSQRLAKECPSFVKGIVFFGFPLHAPGKPSIDRAAHLEKISIPMLFLQGTRDALAEMTLMEKVCSTLPTATLIKFNGADHSFKVAKSVIIPELISNVVNWMNNQ